MKKLSWYWAFRNVLIGPFLKVWNRPTATGLENFPAHGGALIASNHQSVCDSFYLPLLCPRRITFLSKQEYFTGTGLVGGFQRWFFTAVGQVPVDRSGSDAARGALETAVRLVNQGELLGIYPEGTRSPDGRLHRAKTGCARMALETKAPIIPVAMFGTREANPIGSWMLRPTKVHMAVGVAIDPVEVMTEAKLPLDPGNRESARYLADHIMTEIQRLSRQDYVDMYAGEVKKSLAAGEGYPVGARPEDAVPPPPVS